MSSKKRMAHYVWVEKFRPEHVRDMILPISIKKTFNKFVAEKNFPHMLFYSSSPGVGKTTLAKALCNDVDADYLYINTSSKSGIDTLRGTIEKFASTRSFNGQQKVVILDEFDGASRKLQEGLRGAIEEFSKVCRFILTCNYITQIIDPLKSRCVSFDMNMTNKNFVKQMKPQIVRHICELLKFENVAFEKPVIEKLVDLRYPDIRKIIQDCQKYSNMNSNIDENIYDFENVDEEFYEFLMKGKFGSARKYLIERSYDYDEMFTNLYREFIPRLPGEVQPEAILLIAEYMHKNSNVIDKEINFAALMIDLMKII